ncbi:MAG: Gfo/Idh/MocA family oxidoreductase [Opitutaceae bacterium]|nr:Gfo/Idh/MocA family oxidoreductase [Opitutaceae bacterium]
MSHPVLTRRSFVKGAAAATAGLAFTSVSAATDRPRKRYTLIGAGVRGSLFQEAIQRTHADAAELVGVCDINPGRVQLSLSRAREWGVKEPAGFGPRELESYLRSTHTQCVVVTTVDSTHDEYIVRALDAGCDVITEKPMTTTAEKCQRILDACARNRRHVTVAFNYRYTPMRTQVKELLSTGEIGDILSVDFQWLLDTRHGANYFRRWHGEKRYSGGLIVHKATHHFDLVNWWLSAVPVTVTGRGTRQFYTPETARRMGLSGDNLRCRGCRDAASCSFHIDLEKSSNLRKFYLQNEHYDGYIRDQCVFGRRIDIEDSMSALVQYDTGALLTYSLNAFNAWEGCIVAFNGTKGRLEHMARESDDQGAAVEEDTKTRIISLRGQVKDIVPRKGRGGHGGGDPVMMADLFGGKAESDPLLRKSDERGGAASILVGVAANQSFTTGKAVMIADLVTGWTRPEFPPMPGRSLPLT